MGHFRWMAQRMSSSHLTPLLSIAGLQSGYGDVQVLWGVDLAVYEGEIACIVGSNGAGKTTLLRTISGLISATEGSIVFGNSRIEKASPDAVLTHSLGRPANIGIRCNSWILGRLP